VLCLAPEDAVRKAGYAGKPYPHVDVSLSPEGELLVRGPNVFPGYWRNDAATSATLAGGWLHTGDVVERDDEGYFFIKGRLKEMFISGGENVYPVEIETALYGFEEIAECAVMGVPHPRWGEVGLAAVCVRAGRSIDEAALAARLREKLAAYKVPRAFLFVDTMPKTGAGKIDKPALRAKYLQSIQHKERA